LVYHSDGNGLPLNAQGNDRKFKAILLDTGLYSTGLSLRLSDMSDYDNLLLINSGALAEQFVAIIGRWVSSGSIGIARRCISEQPDKVQAMQKRSIPITAVLLLSLSSIVPMACSGGGSGNGAAITDVQNGDSADGGVADTRVVINEVSPNASDGPDWIELYNAGDVDVDLSYWVIEDNNDSHIFSFPAGSLLRTGEYLVIERNADGITGFDFGLGSEDAVRLFDADQAMVDSTEWQDKDALRNRSWGRFPDASGDFITLSAPTRGTQNEEPGPGPSDELFDPEEIVEVNIRMLPEDWDFIRTQTRDFYSLFSGEDCMDQPFEDPFAYRPASVTVNGTELADVGVRKKGFLGSLDEERPSLKVKFDEYVEGQELLGLDRLTLNNNRQDPSHMRQCLGYALFTKAGVPAPRCNLAHVLVNGEDLGIYSNVESIKKRFLARHFSDNDGRLYEGTLSDFREGWTGTFEAKTNRDDPDRSDIDAMVAALNMPDSELVAALASLIDIDHYINFWAMEVLVNHVDGYAGYANNFFLYNSPGTGLLEFIPWGIDGILTKGRESKAAYGHPRSVMAVSKLPNRLYGLPATREKYITQLKHLLGTVWNEDQLLAEIERMRALISPYLPEGTDRTAGVGDSVNSRRAILDAELQLNIPPSWDYPLPDTLCDQWK